MRKGIEKGTDLTDCGYKFNTAEQLEKAAYKIQAHHCDTCQDTGWYGDNCAGRKGNSEYNPCDVCGRGIQADTTSIEQDCDPFKNPPNVNLDEIIGFMPDLPEGFPREDDQMARDSEIQPVTEKELGVRIAELLEAVDERERRKMDAAMGPYNGNAGDQLQARISDEEYHILNKNAAPVNAHVTAMERDVEITKKVKETVVKPPHRLRIADEEAIARITEQLREARSVAFQCQADYQEQQDIIDKQAEQLKDRDAEIAELHKVIAEAKRLLEGNLNAKRE